MLSNFAVQDLVFVVQGYSEDCRLFWGGEIFSWRHSCVPEHFVAGWAMELILAEIAREKKKDILLAFTLKSCTWHHFRAVYHKNKLWQELSFWAQAFKFFFVLGTGVSIHL